MFNKIKEFFTGKPAEVAAEVPYKVEAPVAPTPVAEQATQAVVESIAPAVKKAPAKKAPAVKKAPAAKKPRTPKEAK
jgi:4-hydroxy-L-threonine phosphate dehydrogenase PdxA